MRLAQQHNIQTTITESNTQKRTKRKDELKKEIKALNNTINFNDRWYSLLDLQKMAKKRKIELEVEEQRMDEGWVGASI